jgi:Arc/MetJ-type ribon-helix-helix transcriptional regulator
MTVHLPEDLERSIRAAVQSGHFASVDDVIAEAVRAYLSTRVHGPASPGPAAEPEEAAETHKPIWEEFEEIAASIPAEEWAKLPVDGAEQHDHYIYGTPKRPRT